MSKSRAKLNEAKYFYEQMESKFKEKKTEEFKHCINALPCTRLAGHLESLL